MKVLLNADVEKVGRRGDVVDVSDGYARNFLIPKKLAIAATKGSARQAESMRRSRDERERRERAEVEQLAQRISSTPLRFAARAGEEGQLFGSVTNADIATLLTQALGTDLDRRRVVIPSPIRSLGTHEFAVELGADVTARGTVEVVAAD